MCTFAKELILILHIVHHITLQCLNSFVNRGPGDRDFNWELMVELEPAESLQAGALAELHGLESAPQHNGKTVIVVDTANEQGRYPVQYGQTSLAVKPKNLKLFSGTMEFTVNRMNVQGGGVLVPTDDTLGLGYAKLSFEWQEPVPEDWYFVPDSEFAEWRQPLDAQELERLRDAAYQELEARTWEDYEAKVTRNISKVISAAHVLINSDGPNARLELRTLLATQSLSVAMKAMKELISETENKNFVQVFPVAAQDLIDDKEWSLRCYFQGCSTGITDLPAEAQGLTENKPHE